MRRAAAAAAAAAVLVLAAGPAWAGGKIVDPPPDVVAQHGAIPLIGEVDQSERGRVELQATGPGVEVPVLLAALEPAGRDTPVTERRVEAVLATDACALPVCAGAGTAVNGGYALRLIAVVTDVNGRRTERVLAARPFSLDIPAKTPSGVTAKRTADRVLQVSWARGTERDLLGWSVEDGEGVAEQVSAEACKGDTCTHELTYPAEASGERTLAVRATRACGLPDCVPVSSPPGTSAAVALMGPAQAAPSESPSATPGAAGGTGTATARSFGQGFSRFAPGLGLPKLPPLPKTTTAAPPQVADGTFDPQLDYGRTPEAQVAEPESQAAPRGREGVLRSSEGLLGEEAVRGLAGALVLLMAGAHLRTWLAGTRPDDL